MRLQTLSNLATPASAYPDAVIDGSNSIVVEQGGVLVDVHIMASFKGNGGGARFFVGAVVNGSGTRNVSNMSGVLASVIYDQTSDLVLTGSRQYSPYAGPFMPPGTRIVPMISGSGGATVYYTLNVKFADGPGLMHPDMSNT